MNYYCIVTTNYWNVKRFLNVLFVVKHPKPLVSHIMFFNECLYYTKEQAEIAREYILKRKKLYKIKGAKIVNVKDVKTNRNGVETSKQ